MRTNGEGFEFADVTGRCQTFFARWGWSVVTDKTVGIPGMVVGALVAGLRTAFGRLADRIM